MVPRIVVYLLVTRDTIRQCFRADTSSKITYLSYLIWLPYETMAPKRSISILSGLPLAQTSLLDNPRQPTQNSAEFPKT